MKTRHLMAVALVIVALGAGSMGASVVLADEEEMSLRQVPAAVRATIEKYAAEGRIVEIERERERGQTVYEVEMIVDGREVEFLVSPAGEYLGPEEEEDDDQGEHDDDGDDDEEAISWELLPKGVQKTLSEVIPGVEIGELVRENEDGHVVYEVEYEAEGAEHELELTEAGDIVESERQVPVSSLPAAVAAHVKAKFPGATIEEADLVQITFYEVEIKAGGRERELKILADGRILGKEDDD